MTASVKPISEEDLHAYVDGLLNAERQRSVEAYLETHPDVMARIRGWQTTREMLQRTLGAAAEEPVPPALNIAHLAAARRRRRMAPMRVAAALVLGFGLGAAGGWMARGPSVAASSGVAALAMQAADAQRAFAGDHVHPVEFRAAELPDVLGWIGDRLGRPVAPPDLTGAGYRLMGGRMLATPEGVACLFMYDDDHGTRISVVMRPMRDQDLTAPMRPVNDAGTFGFVWARDGLGVSVVASKQLPTLHDLSNRVRDEMRQL